MKIYNPKSTCPKCGAENAKTEYGGGSFLRRTCGGCGYYWSELTLDAEDDEENIHYE